MHHHQGSRAAEFNDEIPVADGIQGTALGALRGMSDMTLPTVITLTAYWALALPTSYLLGFGLDFGAAGVYPSSLSFR